MICVAVTYRLRPGTEDQAIVLLRQLTELTRQEPGCRMYVAHQSITDPLDLFLYEQYDDQAALDSHRSSAHFIEFATNGIFPLLESRRPVLYVPI